MNKESLVRKQFNYSFNNITLVFIIINVGIFLMDLLFFNGRIRRILALNTREVFAQGRIWQLFTYMFLHGNQSHLFLNMLGLVMFGFTLERRMGSKEFTLFYLLTGTLTGLVSALIMSNTNTSLVGASGALYAVLMAYATYFPDNRILLFFIIPMRAPMAVLLFIVLSIVMQIFGFFGSVAHYAHLAGIAFAFLYFLIRLGINPLHAFRRR